LQALNYELAAGVSDDDLAEEDRYYLSDAYKRTVSCSIVSLVSVIEVLELFGSSKR